MFLYSLAAAMGLNGPGTTLLFVLLSVLFIKWFLKHKQPWKGRLPPGPSALPILGNLFQVDRRAPNKSLMKLGEQYGPVFTIWLGSCPAVVLCGQEAVAEALIERGHDFSGRYVLPVFRKLANDYGIAFSNGERWKQLRRFTLSTLRNFGMGKKSIEERILEEAQFLVTAIRNKKDTPLNPNRLLRCAASNIICSIVFGERFDYEDKMFLTLMEMIAENIQNLNSPWIQLYNSFPTILDFLPGPHKKQFQNAADLLNFIKQMIQSHKESLQKDFPRDYIDSFLIKMEEEEHKHDSEFIHMNLLWTIMNLFLAGTETTSTTLQSAIRILAKYPHIQEKIHSEIDEVVGSCRRPTVEDRVKMPYTDAVIHEVQRYIDLVPMSLPHTVTRDVEFRGYLIPKGTCVVPLLSSVLKATSQWETPEAFNPNHFLCENGHFKKSESFMAFSAGKRICPGESLARMELFLFLTTLLQSFVFNPVIDRKNIDISPVISGFSVVPNDYEFYAISR
ncbi:cytochrome P450 2C3-like isoform X3 [Scyliorhinus torazame]|uniref:cytochrome P450 2C3-like isoform X3 n=1 Tax=Scyliorhinus torazame TaxID=75743 RepID=UPI003B5C873C